MRKFVLTLAISSPCATVAPSESTSDAVAAKRAARFIAILQEKRKGVVL
jgi:hypothetical protein